jgi:hypothetical protein
MIRMAVNGSAPIRLRQKQVMKIVDVQVAAVDAVVATKSKFLSNHMPPSSMLGGVFDLKVRHQLIWHYLQMVTSRH